MLKGTAPLDRSVVVRIWKGMKEGVVSKGFMLPDEAAFSQAYQKQIYVKRRG